MGQTLLYALYMHYPIISSQYPTGLSTFIIPNLQMRKLDCRQVKKLAHEGWVDMLLENAGEKYARVQPDPELSMVV